MIRNIKIPHFRYAIVALLSLVCLVPIGSALDNNDGLSIEQLVANLKDKDSIMEGKMLKYDAITSLLHDIPPWKVIDMLNGTAGEDAGVFSGPVRVDAIYTSYMAARSSDCALERFLKDPVQDADVKPLDYTKWASVDYEAKEMIGEYGEYFIDAYPATTGVFAMADWLCLEVKLAHGYGLGSLIQNVTSFVTKEEGGWDIEGTLTLRPTSPMVVKFQATVSNATFLVSSASLYYGVSVLKTEAVMKEFGEPAAPLPDAVSGMPILADSGIVHNYVETNGYSVEVSSWQSIFREVTPLSDFDAFATISVPGSGATIVDRNSGYSSRKLLRTKEDYGSDRRLDLFALPKEYVPTVEMTTAPSTTTGPTTSSFPAAATYEPAPSTTPTAPTASFQPAVSEPPSTVEMTTAPSTPTGPTTSSFPAAATYEPAPSTTPAAPTASFPPAVSEPPATPNPTINSLPPATTTTAEPSSTPAPEASSTLPPTSEPTTPRKCQACNATWVSTSDIIQGQECEHGPEHDNSEKCREAKELSKNKTGIALHPDYVKCKEIYGEQNGICTCFACHGIPYQYPYSITCEPDIQIYYAWCGVESETNQSGECKTERQMDQKRPAYRTRTARTSNGEICNGSHGNFIKVKLCGPPSDGPSSENLGCKATNCNVFGAWGTASYGYVTKCA